MTFESLSIIIPVYNEERFIEPLLRKVVHAAGDSEIFVIDDGSTDQTPAILSRLLKELPIQVVSHPRNLGKGSAVRTGLAHTRRELILIQDADLEYDPEEYALLLRPLLQGRVQVVYGSRFLGAHPALSCWRRLGNWLITNLVNLCFHASLTDVETGYKVFRREAVNHLALQSTGFDLEVELTCQLLKAGRVIVEIPISYDGRTDAEGKKVTWKHGLSAIATTLRCRFA